MLNKFQIFLTALAGRFSSQYFQNLLVDFLKKKAVKAVLKKFVITGGLKAWLITFVVEELVEEADEKIIEPVFRKIGYIGDSLNGKLIYRKAVEVSNHRDQWRDLTDRM